MSDVAPPRSTDDFGGPEISGKWLILGIAAFAIAVTGTLYVYWSLHRGPFLAFQKAIAAEYEGSRPLVEGGREKMHEGGPAILRAIVEVDFDPNADEHRAAVDAIADRLVELGREHLETFDEYDRFDVHLFLQEREKVLHEHTVEIERETGERTHVSHDPRLRLSPQ